MGCCASSDNTEKPGEMRQASRLRLDEMGIEAKKSNGAVTEDLSSTSANLKNDGSSNNSKVPKLDMTKVSNGVPVPGTKPKVVNHGNPEEPELKEDRDKLIEAAEQEAAKKGSSIHDQKTDALVKGSSTEGKSLNTLNQGAPGPMLKNENHSNPQIQKKPSSLKNIELKVGPDIFVSLKTGSLNDFYKPGDLLGEGAYGQVCLVTHRTTGIVRARKSISKKSVLKEAAEKLFAEVSILKELDHPNIVKLYELFQDDTSYYLVTEYCTGGELFDRIQQMQSFSEKQASEYMKQILSAIVYCHSKHIVHRDLKPENLLMDSKKHNASIKVIDFGTSRRFETGKKMTQKFGTPYYIAPEVLSKNYDEKCDVWSCGVILYILLCGYPPFNGRTDADIISKVRAGKYSFDDPEWSRISQDAKNLIKKMLTYDPAQRISAREALDDTWMTKNNKNQPLNKTVLDNLSSFDSKNKLKQAILTFIATQITTQQERDELQRTFQQLDKDRNGILTKDELIEGYIKVFGANSRVSAEEKALHIINQVDVNGSGQIDFTEFIMAAMSDEMLLSKQKIAHAFKLFDQNGDGFITRQELAAVMGGIELDDEEWRQIIEEVDTNNDGKISQEEFVTLLQKNKKRLV